MTSHRVLPDLEGDIATDRDTLREHSFDWSSIAVTPEVVVYPRTSADIRRLVDYVRDRKADDPSLSITCRSAGTDVTGGPLNDSIILDFMRYFTDFTIGRGQARVQPGVYYRDFDEQTRKQGLFLPSAPESKDLCALGGMIANDSGGQKTLRYGKTKDFVEELTVILQDGHEYVFTEISKDELEGLKRLEPLTFIDDVVVAPERLGEFLPKLENVIDGYGVKYTIIGHIGNGNLHVITLMDLEDPDIAEKNDRMSREVNQLVAEFEGSLSGERNDGRTRGPFLELMYGSDMTEYFRRTKEIFDPHAIFNPANKIDADWQHTLDHIRTEGPHKPGTGLGRKAAWLAVAAVGLGATLAYVRRRSRQA